MKPLQNLQQTLTIFEVVFFALDSDCQAFAKIELIEVDLLRSLRLQSVSRREFEKLYEVKCELL